MTLQAFTDAYVDCAIWSSGDDEDATAWANAALAPETLASMQADCKAFYAAHADSIEDDSRAGHDFWLTRCGHGAGFWDGDWPEPAATILTDASKAFGNVDLYVGDDGLIYS